MKLFWRPQCDVGANSEDIGGSFAHSPARNGANSRSPRRAGRVRSPRWAQCGRLRLCLLFLGALMMLGLVDSARRASGAATNHHGGTSRPVASEFPITDNSADATPRAARFVVESTAALHAMCKEHAPVLATTTWARYAQRTNKTFMMHAEGGGEFQQYAFVANPVCVHRHTGLLFAGDADSQLNGRMELRGTLPYTRHGAQFYDLHQLFSVPAQPPLNASTTHTSHVPHRTAVQVIPALAIMPFGSFISSHMWHLINDALARFLITIHGTADRDFWDSPRQAVLVDEQGERWLDRNGDTLIKTRLSSAILNGLSSFEAASARRRDTESAAQVAGTHPNEPHATHMVPAFVDEPLVVTAEANVTLSALIARDPHFDRDTVCFCQAVFVPVYPYLLPIPPQRSLFTLQDRTALSFGAPPYKNLTEESVWDIERQRIERYPAWARQFWPTTAGTAAYQPRVLFIHRAKRTIANVAAYVKAMRDMGFRVEEVYLERLPTAQQYYLGRYADVVVGMHGLGIGHALWMNCLPTGCRTVIEFRLWASPGAANGLEGLLQGGAGFAYRVLQPYDVAFGSTVRDKRTARLKIIQMWTSAYQHPGWDDQQAIFLDHSVLGTLSEVKAHLQSCLAL